MAAAEARSMLDALMGADRNAHVEGASGIASYGDSGPVSGPTRRKKSCYDKDICPLYCAWSISSQDEPTWAEGMAVNEGMGGIDVFVSAGFTELRNPYIVQIAMHHYSRTKLILILFLPLVFVW